MARLEQQRLDELGARIRELRGHVPQQKIADQVGVTLRAYQAWERGEAMPHWDNLEAIANLHGVGTDWLINGDRGDTPDLALNGLDPLKVQLKRIESKLDALLDAIPEPQPIAQEDELPALRPGGQAEPPTSQDPAPQQTPPAKSPRRTARSS